MFNLFKPRHTAYVGMPSDLNESLFEGQGKLATIWFDTIVIQGPNFRVTDDCIRYVQKRWGASEEVAKELNKAWVALGHMVRGYDFLEDTWENKNAKLVNAALKITSQKIKREWPQHIPIHSMGFNHELRWAGAGLIDSVKGWMMMNKERPTSYLPDREEEKVLKVMFRKSKIDPKFKLFSKVADIKLPDLSATPWEKVIELRHNKFLSQFREHMAKVQKQFRDKGDKVSLRSLIKEMELDANRKIIELARPSLGKAILKAVASVIPLPSPLDLVVSGGMSAKDVREELDKTQKFGWFYFQMDLSK